MSVDQAFPGWSSGDRGALARAISAVESGLQGWDTLLRVARGLAGRARVVGITGPPGAGKSTLIDQLIVAYRQLGQRVAVLAVDPTSPFSGGAVLGDRVRMQGHAGDADVFIRSMATRGALGGIARATADIVTVLDAAGYGTVLVESVGVGQGEVEIARLADVTVVMAVPGSGDDVQALKAGLMEVADVFVVNKADREGADATAANIEAALSLVDRRPDEWRPPVLCVSAATGLGVETLVGAIDRAAEAPERRAARRRRALARPDAGPVPNEIDHVGIATDDLDASRWLFETALGLRASSVEDLPLQGVRVQFLGHGGAQLELVAPGRSDSPIAAFLDKRGPGLHHVAIRVVDLDAALEHLRSHGVRLIDAAPRIGARGHRVAFVHPSSAQGVLVELVERGDD
jgi:LAO/AO transport system kinase